MSCHDVVAVKKRPLRKTRTPIQRNQRRNGSRKSPDKPRRKKKRRVPQGLQLKRWLIRHGVLLATAIFGYVACINACVSHVGGGNPHLLSPLRMQEKSQALWTLAKHAALHPLRKQAHPYPTSLLHAAADRHRIPVALLMAVARVESNLDPHSISRAGAMGLMQLMPQTAAELGVTDPFDSAQSIDGAARYLRKLWNRYGGDERRIIAAYNAGPGAVPRHGHLTRLPAETRVYVRRVLAVMP